MGNLFRRARRSSSEGQHLLPAASSISSFMSISTLFAWTFGSGAVFWRIWPAVLMYTVLATVVTVVSLRTNVDLAMPNIMVTVLGVVIGFVISYRVSCAYDQYWMGRTAWSNVSKNIVTLSRLIWFHVPLLLSPKTQQGDSKPVAPLRDNEESEVETVMSEKWIALEMLEGFAISLKHRLRGDSEYCIFYEDLYHLVKPLHKHHAHCIDSQSPTAVDGPWHHGGKSAHSPPVPPMTPFSPMSIARSASGASSSQSVHPHLHTAGSEYSRSLLDRVSADLIPFAPYLRGLFKFYRSSGKSDRQPGSGIDSRAGVQSLWTTGVPVVGRKTPRRIVRGDKNIPVEILRLLSDWFAMLEQRATVPGSSIGAMMEAISALEDAVSLAEKTLTTPLPFIYAVHIRTVWLYLFFLPFQLVEQFSWYTIPGVALASFIYFGFISAGDEIGQPFGYDENDLDLDLICREMVQADLARLKKTPGVNVFLGPREATPQDADLLGI